MKKTALLLALMVSLAAMANADTLNVTDMSFNGENASAVYGSLNTNDSLNLINTFEWGTDWAFLLKDESGTSDPTVAFNGIQFKLTANAIGGTSGNWTLTALDINGSSAYNMGDYFDFVGVIKAGHELGAYLFEDIELEATNSGSWTISFTNDRNGNINGLSHISLYVRESNDPFDETFPAPEPGGLILLGSGLLALASLKFRKR